MTMDKSEIGHYSCTKLLREIEALESEARMRTSFWIKWTHN
jgi:hypothetical protein